ncbi:MAG: hypothetical protein F6K50_05635 [Moorea sp. SIO3I7]|nr:hypothetical protein [Moorena sp. SIO3I7]
MAFANASRTLLATAWQLATLREKSITTVEVGFNYDNPPLDVYPKQSVDLRTQSGRDY